MDSFGVEWYDVLNWEKIKTGNTQWWKKDKGWLLPSDAFMTLDEAHKQCSGADSQAGKLMAALKGRDILLSSATMAASPLQMRHSGYILGLHQWDRTSWVNWLVANGCSFDKENRYWRAPTHRKGREVMAAINRRIADMMVYRRHSDVPGFPECDLQVKVYNLNDRDTKEIKAAYAEMSERMRKPGASELAETGKCRERTEMLKTGLFLELAEEALEQDMSPVFFLNYREPMSRLREMLVDKGITNVSVIVGGQSETERNIQRDRFQDNTNHVALVMTQAGGIAISLHDVLQVRPRIAYINPSYHASEVRQCLGRIWRTGGTKALQRFVLAAGTIEEFKVYPSIKAKLKNIDQLNDSDLAVD